ncbi:MAG: hypothetical protein J0M30_10600 [Chitinophagales bacterium]|nr:hypothetical protein [Chitinophagales bacterium]
MKGALDQIAQSFFQRDSWDELSVADIKAMTDKHPYFSGGQVMLALKAKEAGDEHAEQLVLRASLYMANPLVFDQMIRNLEDTDQAWVNEESPEIRQILEREMEVAEEEVTEIELAPQHTVDYFASQGIQDKPQGTAENDRFSHQLRSFTEWLKTLKKLTPDQPVPTHSAPEEEEKITHLAEDSLQEPEVLTEAMAEIWLKQGDGEKAKAIYHKLSLLNPAKSAYFASLIDKINASK